MNHVRLLVGILVSIAVFGVAQGSKAEEGPCRGDVERLCRDVKPGGGRIIGCLKEHSGELSEGCREGMTREHRKNAKERGEGKGQWKGREEKTWACREEAQKYCFEVKPGEGRILRCLDEHKAELSTGCQNALAREGRWEDKKGWKERKGMQAKHHSCREDRERFCKDVKEGEGRIVRCMKEHENELSEGCREAISHEWDRGRSKEREPGMGK